MNDVVIPTLTPEEKGALLRDLKEAYYLGAKRVRFRERDVTYRSREEMKAIIDELEGEQRARKRKHVILTTFNRGY